MLPQLPGRILPGCPAGISCRPCVPLHSLQIFGADLVRCCCSWCRVCCRAVAAVVCFAAADNAAALCPLHCCSCRRCCCVAAAVAVAFPFVLQLLPGSPGPCPVPVYVLPGPAAGWPPAAVPDPLPGAGRLIPRAPVYFPGWLLFIYAGRCPLLSPLVGVMPAAG